MTRLLFMTLAVWLVDFPCICGRATIRTCESPQYIEMGSTITLRCDFHHIYAAYWYETTESGRHPPVIRYEDSRKSGRGFDTREYDVHPDGSLIINSVTLKHDTTFRVIFLLEKDGISSQEDVHAIVTVHPNQTFPTIDKCEGERVCFKERPSNTPITCVVDNARPAINLAWVKRTKYADTPISSSQEVSTNNDRYTSVQRIEGINYSGHSLLLLVCKSDDTPPLLLDKESAILLNNPTPTTSSDEDVGVREVDSGSTLLLPCNDTQSVSLIWDRGNDGAFVTLIATALSEKFRFVDGVDLTADGALVIQDVGLDHEGMYKCTYSDGITESVIVYQVTVRVRPVQSFPIIEECGQSRFCNRKLESNSVLRCIVREARPPVTLGWYRRTNNGLEKITSTSNTVQNDQLYTSYADHFVSFDTTFISVLVCQSLDEPPLLSIKDSFILIEDLHKNVPDAEAIPHYVQRHSSLTLDCNSARMIYTIWKRKAGDGIFETLLFVSLNDSKTVDSAYYVQGNDGLALDDVSVQHEGIYICIYGDGRQEYEKSYNAIVYINPEPNYLAVDGCEGQQYCVLSKGRSGNITCSVRGVRPTVDLEWTTADPSDIQKISFTNQKVLKNSNEETFDIEVTSSFHINDLSLDRLSIACKTDGPNSEILKLRTTLDLMFTEDLAPPERTIVIVIAIVLLIIMLITAVLGFWCCRKRRGKAMEARSSFGEYVPEEYTEMLTYDATDGPSRGTSSNDARFLVGDKKKQFIDDLKDKYKNWTSQVRPLPSYGRKLQFEVDDIFVDGGIKILAPRKRGMIQDEWNILDSYHEVFQINATRIIIEGDPGFGKSTMMLKAAHDWSTSNNKSPLKDIDIFILLQLRKLGGIKSLYSAIKKRLLPKESKLNSGDIEEIILGSSSVVLALDDFDEYPDRESKSPSDFLSIIAGDMLNKVKVILLTRTTCLPENYRADTQFVRLTGFNRKVQGQYITKAFGSTEKLSANTITSNLDINTIMNDIVKVPMFFAMFAHITSISNLQSNFTTATQFFRYVLDQIESRDKGLESVTFCDTDYLKLGEVAFQTLFKNKPLTWTRQTLINKIGEDICLKFLTVGILVQENNGIVPTTNLQKTNQKEVKFHHKIFCEWYAGHFLAKRLDKRDYETILRKLNPFDLQYLYRFTCGLNQPAADKIISYIENGENGEQFAILCELEKTGNAKNIALRVEKMCSNIVSIYGGGSRLLRKSTALILEIASENAISIKSVLLDRCVRTDEEYPDHLGLGPDSFIPPLNTLSELRIYNVGQNLSQEINDHILRYCTLCGQIKSLQFLKTFQPQIVLRDKPDILASLRDMEITVTWTPLKSEPEFILDLKSGKWKFKNETTGSELSEDEDNVLNQTTEIDLSEDKHNALLIEFNRMWNTD